MSTPILGRPEGTNNPLVVLNQHLSQITEVLAQIATNTRPDATAILPHVYVVARNDDPQQGAMWGSFCLACTDSAGNYVFPCAVVQDPIHPPAFFTIGDVYIPDDAGRMRRYESPSN